MGCHVERSAQESRLLTWKALTILREILQSLANPGSNGLLEFG